jgi:hypothetical protein
MILPAVSGPATQWVLYDYGQTFLNSPPATGGTATVHVAQVPSDQLWMIDLVRVKTAVSDVTSTALVCIGDPSRDVIGTATGGFDVADMSSPIHAPASTDIFVVWQNIPNGLQGNVYMQWTVLQSASTLAS